MSSSKWRQMIKSHPLVETLLTVKGNARTLLYLEPLWGIPFNLITPFASLYMYALGVNDMQIGLLLSISTTLQVLFSFMGGIITDKLGRRITTIIGDFFGWSVACAVWAISQNFWYFLIAMTLNCFEQVNQTAWGCLMIEDAPKSQILNIYTWVSIAGLLAVFFAPLSGLLIGHYTLVPVIRVLYGIFSFNMLIKSYVTWRYTKETQQGLIRKKETKSVSVASMIGEYKTIVPRVFKNRDMLRVLAIMVILFVTNQVSTNFFALYANQTLGVPQTYIAYFPILRAALMLVLMFTLEVFLNKRSFKAPMLTGFVIYIGAQLLLVFTRSASVLPLVTYTLMDALAYALVVPRKDAMVALFVDPKERARITALMVSLMQLFSAPFGALAGTLSGINRRLPFCMSVLFFTVAIIVLWTLQGKTKSTGHKPVEETAT